MCACGEPIFIVKTGECRRCYNRRYSRERYVPVQSVAPAVSSLDLAEAMRLVEAEILERDRVVAAAAASLYRAENREKVLAAKAEYRKRNRESIRQRDAIYRAMNSEQRTAYERAHRKDSRERVARYYAANKEKIAARKKTRYWALKTA